LTKRVIHEPARSGSQIRSARLAGVSVSRARARKKKTLHAERLHDATTDAAIIECWWWRWPNALNGLPTGAPSSVVVFDIDVKNSPTNGYDSLEDLGHVLPATPMVHTPSCGLHVYFASPERELRCSSGLIGPGLDVRGEGGYVILPSPGSGYSWDPIHNFDSVAPAPAPNWLWPVKPSIPVPATPLRPVKGLDRYGESAINAACDAIFPAAAGEQERTLNAECFSIGTLAGAGAVPAELALSALLRAGLAMPSHDPRWPWRPEEIDLKVRRAFAAGQLHPRRVRHVAVA
jgi:Bifunctional DNA primase/polymerase, N-terminal